MTLDMEEFVEDLRTLVGFRTVVCRNPDEFARADEWVRHFLADTDAELIEYDCHGLTTSVIRPPGSTRPTLIGDGHIEVVPGAEPQFTLRLDGSRAYGRGTADMKTAVLVMLYVMRDLLRGDDHHDLWLVLSEDEEVGSQAGAAVVVDDLVRRGLLPSVAFIPDGGHDFAYVEKEKGIAAFHVVASGPGGHASRPWLAENPVETVMAFARDLAERFPHPDGEDDWRPSAQLTVIHSGDAASDRAGGGHEQVNQVPQQCRAGFDVRFTEDFTPDDIRGIIGELAAGHGLRAAFDKCDPAATYPRDAPIGAAYLDLLRDVTDREPAILHSAGASNGRLYDVHGTHVLMSNATAGGAHSRREWVDLDSVPAFHDLVHRTVRMVDERS